MTNHVGRLYALSAALLMLFLTWAIVASRPWVRAAPDPRLAALAAREQRLRRESLVVREIVRRRWTVYRVQLRKRQAQIAAAKRAQAAAAAASLAASATAAAGPSVRVVSLPPITITRTS